METPEIVVGLQIAIYVNGKVAGMSTIERVTATQLVLKNGVKLRHNLSLIGQPWSNNSYAHITPEIQMELKLKRSRNLVLKKLEELTAAVKNGDVDMDYLNTVYLSVKELLPVNVTP